MSFSENEMRGLLTGKCIPGDMKVNEELPAYLVRKFAALQEQVQKMAAENQAIKKFCKNAAFDADYEANLCMEHGGFTDGLNDIETPATDAVIREIGAKAVERFGDVLGLGSLHLALILKKCAYDHAAKLRVGEQP
jgi:hypothetical protein